MSLEVTVTRSATSRCQRLDGYDVIAAVVDDLLDGLRDDIVESR
jgi:hypothetical protein